MPRAWSLNVPIQSKDDLVINRYENSWIAKASFSMESSIRDGTYTLNGDMYKNIIVFSAPIQSGRFIINNLYADMQSCISPLLDNGELVNPQFIPTSNIDTPMLVQKLILGVSDGAIPTTPDYTLFDATNDISQSEQDFNKINTNVITISQTSKNSNRDIKLDVEVNKDMATPHLNIFCETKLSMYNYPNKYNQLDLLRGLFIEIDRQLIATYPTYQIETHAFCIHSDFLIKGKFNKKA